MSISMLQSTIQRSEILRGRSTSIALPPGLIRPRSAHRVDMMFIEKSRNPQQISHAHQVGSQLVHHLLLAGTRAREVQLPAEDGGEDVELLGDFFSATWGAYASSQARGDALEIQLADGEVVVIRFIQV